MREMAFDCCLQDNKEWIHKGDFKHIHDNRNEMQKAPNSKVHRIMNSSH